MKPPYVALPKAAKRLGVSRERAIELIHEGALRAKLASGRWWIETQSLDGLLRARGRQFGPGPGRAA